jgi:2-C-methyl-D-erythritol 4-phosphate cytidylyltransferase
MEDAGFQNIESVEGSVMTMKITNPRDLEIAALYLR